MPLNFTDFNNNPPTTGVDYSTKDISNDETDATINVAENLLLYKTDNASNNNATKKNINGVKSVHESNYPANLQQSRVEGTSYPEISGINSNRQIPNGQWMMTATISFLPTLPTPTLLSIQSEGFKSGDKIIVYKTTFNLPAYLTACLVLNDEICLSSTQLKKSPDLLEWNYIYETEAKLVNNIDPGTRCYLMIFDNIFRICGFYYVDNLQVKCTNCNTMETPVWRYLENRKKVCNAFLENIKLIDPW
ncbi:hypothetical protein C1645_834592 [Glomus cerebriforme]|uniref:GATA-type domain-containing protein n=1 Tax=Glomus cerebriforme TaxID=658196 RepID=A0A397S9B7_9GLOM|nr:hypothetical protein C1645_834592 [Glomus cerebriforme]